MKFFYLRDKHNFPCVTVASSRIDNHIFYGVATHNPHDTYRRNEGKRQAASLVPTNLPGAILYDSCPHYSHSEAMGGTGNVPEIGFFPFIGRTGHFIPACAAHRDAYAKSDNGTAFVALRYVTLPLERGTVKHTIVTQIANDESLPQRARECARLWLREHAAIASFHATSRALYDDLIHIFAPLRKLEPSLPYDAYPNDTCCKSCGATWGKHMYDVCPDGRTRFAPCVDGDCTCVKHHLYRCEACAPSQVPA